MTDYLGVRTKSDNQHVENSTSNTGCNPKKGTHHQLVYIVTQWLNGKRTVRKAKINAAIASLIPSAKDHADSISVQSRGGNGNNQHKSGNETIVPLAPTNVVGSRPKSAKEHAGIFFWCQQLWQKNLAHHFGSFQLGMNKYQTDKCRNGCLSSRTLPM